MQERRVTDSEGPRLPAGFLLRAVSTDADVERFVEINRAVTGEGEIARRLIAHRPSSLPGDFFMIEEEDTGRVVSTTCLLRWQLSFEGISLNAAMLEMVVTDPACRRLGLVRAQIGRFHERAVEVGAPLCIIQGIPFYYRQFGYGYALDHTPVIELDAQGAGGVPKASGLLARPASAVDAAACAELYAAEMSRQELHVRRTKEDWEYLLARTDRRFEIVEGPGSSGPLGYLLAWREEESLMIGESGLKDPDDAPEVLAVLGFRGAGSLRVCGNAAHSLARAAAARGGKARIPSQWLVRVADPVALLTSATPVLESRLARAGFRDLDAEVLVNLFKSSLRMRIVRGQITAVENAGFVDASMGEDGGDLCIPPDAFARLLLGYRDLDQVRDAWPDTTIRAASRPVLDALFPRMNSLVLMPY